MSQISEAKAREMFGDPKETSLRLRRFSESARALSSSHPRLIEDFSHRWVAIHGGKVWADAASLDELLDDLDDDEIRRDECIIRFIDRNQRALIL